MPSPIGLIAGRGGLPLSVAQEAERSGRSVFVVKLEGFAEPGLDAFPGTHASIGELGKTQAALREAGCEEVVFAGKVDRPDMAKLRIDARGQAALGTLVPAATKGDDGLLTALIDLFERDGFKIVGPEGVSSSFLAPSGVMVGLDLADQVRADFVKAYEIAGLIGGADIGQGVVVCQGVVLAVEAQEGTDAMLERVATLPLAVRGAPDRRRGVLVKRARPQQDRRMDLPAIGPETLKNAAAAGLLGVGVEAGAALI
ncbi:MAG: UDP-2,3-diacylglucosamine diphosphatase LpxI, partial [Pseudomonadota bacterium]